MNQCQILDWLLLGDIAIQYQVYRDLLGIEKKSLRNQILKEGWGEKFLNKRKEAGYWGQGFYQPKWISTHYTLLDLKNLCAPQNNKIIQQSIIPVIKSLKATDGGIYPIGPEKSSDVCVNGMFLNYACYFHMDENSLKSIVDFLLNEHMNDGGFNCNSNRRCGAVHSSVHSTLSVLEGIYEYEHNGYKYRKNELVDAKKRAIEFLLIHKLFRSHRTGEMMDKKMTMLSFPSRWKYDILRALDYFRLEKLPYDNRMDDAFEILFKKRRRDGTWPLQAKHPGKTHFEMEKPGKPSRWNTLRALRVLKHFRINTE